MTDRGRICAAFGIPDDRKSRQVQICLPGFLILFCPDVFFSILCFRISGFFSDIIFSLISTVCYLRFFFSGLLFQILFSGITVKAD